jgi:hypothetical protein
MLLVSCVYANVALSLIFPLVSNRAHTYCSRGVYRWNSVSELSKRRDRSEQTALRRGGSNALYQGVDC